MLLLYLIPCIILIVKACDIYHWYYRYSVGITIILPLILINGKNGKWCILYLNAVLKVFCRQGLFIVESQIFGS